MYQHFIETKEDRFQVRPWGGQMCFLGLPETVNCKKLAETAVLRMQHGQCHEGHSHDTSDEILCVLRGKGLQTFWDADGNETSYEINPGDLLYIAKNRVHRTENLSETEDLELFITQYFLDTQSDVTRKGFIAANSVPTLSEAYGTCTNIIREDTCGNRSISGDFLSINPGACFEADVKDEEFLFVISGSVLVSYTGSSEATPINAYTLGFFHGEEHYIVQNRADVLARLYRVRLI